MLVFQHIDIAHWAGLGGVRYIPSEYVDTETGNLKELDESEVKMINQRNMELVSHHKNHSHCLNNIMKDLVESIKNATI